MRTKVHRLRMVLCEVRKISELGRSWRQRKSMSVHFNHYREINTTAKMLLRYFYFPLRTLRFLLTAAIISCALPTMYAYRQFIIMILHLVSTDSRREIFRLCLDRSRWYLIPRRSYRHRHRYRFESERGPLRTRKRCKRRIVRFRPLFASPKSPPPRFRFWRASVQIREGLVLSNRRTAIAYVPQRGQARKCE